MRRKSFSARGGGPTSESGGEQGFWPSYADMMSSMALILFFLMLLSYIQNLITGNDLQNTQEVLADTRIELTDAQDRLSLLTKQVTDAEDKLANVQGELDSAKITLDLQQKEIAGYSLTIEEQTETIASQEKLIGDQEDYLAAANKEIVAMRNQMQTIAVLRVSILEKICDSITKVMGDASKVSIGDNGNIILSEGVLFDTGSSAIKAGSTNMLNELIEVFSEFLSDEENAKYVDSIVISGHTDSTGNAAYNRQLSTDRANSVLNYLLTGKNGKLDEFSSFFCAAGYGATRPVASNDTAAGQAANRRIEISMILRDDTVMDIVEQYLDLTVPEA